MSTIVPRRNPRSPIGRRLLRAPRLLGALLLACALVASVACALAAQDAPAAPDRSDALAARCDELAEAHRLPGVVLVAQGDDVLLERAYGLADRDRALANGAETRFYVASLTKAVVVFAALRLVDEGVVALDDRVERWVPELLDTDAGCATLHELLAHTSGLPHYEALPELENAQRAYAPEELLELLAGLEAVAPPGARHHYSGPGYLALGFALERASGEALPALVRRLVLDPLGLEDTTLVDGTSEPGPHARLYRREDGALVEVPMVPQNSSVANWLSFARAHEWVGQLRVELVDFGTRAGVSRPG